MLLYTVKLFAIGARDCQELLSEIQDNLGISESTLSFL